MKIRTIKLLLLLPLLAGFYTAKADGEHWTWNPHQYPNNSIFVAVITIDDVEQRSDQLEIAAFYEETCRGSVMCQYEPRKDRYYAYLIVNGDSGMELNFRLWDHVSDSELDVTCGITYTFQPDESYGLPSNPYVFPFTTNPTQVVFNGTANELWSVPGNWEGNVLPAKDDIAIINAPCQLDQDAEVLQLVVNDDMSLTVTEGHTLTAGTIASDTATKLVVANGAQLVCDNREGVFATVLKYVSGYGTDNDKWCFIASPLTAGTVHTEVGNLVNEEGYDLYAFDQTEVLEWRNFKDNDLTMNPGEGYLYANTDDVVLEFAGELNSTVGQVTLSYGSEYTQAGWNLVGNPFARNAYADRSYYVLDETGSAISPVAASQATTITPCTGIMVKANGEGETVTFGTSAASASKGILSLTVSNAGRSIHTDHALVSFQHGDALSKYVFDNDNPKLWIAQDGRDYAIVSSEKQGEVPVNFKAVANGSYTLTVDSKDVEMEYLHLVDHLTGEDVDLLATPHYTFEAKTSDYASRFKLVFKANDDNVSSSTFAFFNGDDWTVRSSGAAILQVVDVTGRIVKTMNINGDVNLNTGGFNVGIYTLCLIDGVQHNNQKIIVK